MRNGQINEMRFVLSILKSPEIEYNANNLAKQMNLSSMGTLKIARKLQKERVISSRKVGKASIFSIDLNNDYSMHYIKFLLKKELEVSSPYVKRWANELYKIKSSDGIILFGSVLNKEKEARDIDTLIIVNEKSFNSVKKEVDSINSINDKKVHPVYQTREDLKKHIKERNKVILNAIKGIFISGEDNLIKVLKNESL